MTENLVNASTETRKALNIAPQIYTIRFALVATIGSSCSRNHFWVTYQDYCLWKEKYSLYTNALGRNFSGRMKVLSQYL